MMVGGGKKLEACQHTRPRPSGITQAFSYIVHPPANATQTTRTLFLSFTPSLSGIGHQQALGNIGVDWGSGSGCFFAFSCSRRATGPSFEPFISRLLWLCLRARWLCFATHECDETIATLVFEVMGNGEVHLATAWQVRVTSPALPCPIEEGSYLTKLPSKNKPQIAKS